MCFGYIYDTQRRATGTTPGPLLATPLGSHFSEKLTHAVSYVTCILLFTLYHLFVILLQLLSHSMLVSLACYLGDEFTPVAHAAMDKYLSAFAAVLAEKYR